MASAICDEGELAALASMFKGNETAATAFCEKLGKRVTGIEEGMNTFFLTVMGALVFIMHAGFAMVSPRHCHSSCFS
jgi:tetrahydromethanopterin S-methyltransferase subunit E